MTLVILDTDVSSLTLRHRLPPPLANRLARHTPCVTFVTIGELTKWTKLRNWGPQRLSELEDWMQHVAVLPYDRAVAVTWGDLQARAQRRGRPAPPNDTWIAACCIVYGLPLATLNHKDFEDFVLSDGLQLMAG